MDQQINVKVTLYNDSDKRMRVKLDINGNKSGIPFEPGLQTTVHEELSIPVNIKGTISSSGELVYQRGTCVGIPKECTTKDDPVPVCLIIGNNITEVLEIVNQLKRDDTPGHFFYALNRYDVEAPWAKFETLDKIYLDMRLKRENRHVYSLAHSHMIDTNPKGLVIPIWIK